MEKAYLVGMAANIVMNEGCIVCPLSSGVMRQPMFGIVVFSRYKPLDHIDMLTYFTWINEEFTVNVWFTDLRADPVFLPSISLLGTIFILCHS